MGTRDDKGLARANLKKYVSSDDGRQLRLAIERFHRDFALNMIELHRHVIDMTKEISIEYEAARLGRY